MKLYYSPGACSLAAHIAICEAGLNVPTEAVNLAKHTTADGRDFTAINPKGYVPALEMPDGSILTEATVVLQYVADQAPGSGLMPPAGTIGRYRAMEWLNFLATEIHKSFGPLFHRGTPEAVAEAKAKLLKRLGYIDERLSGQDYLTGPTFTVADAYLYVFLTWLDHFKIDISALPNVTAFKARVAARPKVKEALVAEGLLKAA